MKRIFKHSVFIITISLFFSVTNSHGAVRFNISNTDIPKTKILLYGFESRDPTIKGDIEEILDRIKKNLGTTNLFQTVRKHDSLNLIPFKADEQHNEFTLIDQIPNFDKYSTLDISAMLVGDVAMDVKGNLEVKVRLWDILDERQFFGKIYSAGRGNHKRMANMISDEIFKAITGEKSGHFNSHITYIAESGRGLNRIKRVAMIDFDGENKRYLTDGKDLVLTPVFSKRPQEIVFLRYIHNTKPQIYNLDMNSMTIKKIGGFLETTFAPSVHPKNSNLMLFSLIENGNSNIYEMNIVNNRIIKLTNSRSINTTPSYSPDGSSIIFSSDRSGSQKIYIMDSNGRKLKRISEGGGSYSKPVWSPDGTLIAFTKIQNGNFKIGLMTPDGKNEKIIVNDYIIEGAKWSPNSRYLIYSRQSSAYGSQSVPKLYMVDILTGFERQIPINSTEGASDPDWALKWSKG